VKKVPKMMHYIEQVLKEVFGCSHAENSLFKSEMFPLLPYVYHNPSYLARYSIQLLCLTEKAYY
jgi:hypothetical protein